jgi:hypothetical protein
MTAAQLRDRFGATLSARYPAIDRALGRDADRDLALGVVEGLAGALARLSPGTGPDAAAARLFLAGRIDRATLTNLLLLLEIRDRFAPPSSVHWDFRHVWHLAQGLIGPATVHGVPPATDAWQRFEHAALAALFELDRLDGPAVPVRTPAPPPSGRPILAESAA